MLKSPHSPVNIPSITLHDALFESFRTNADKKALVDGLTGTTLTYRDLDKTVRRVASGLNRLGVGHQDVVACFSPNSHDFIFFLFAAMCNGAPVALINPSYTAYELEHHLRTCQPTWIFTTSKLYKTAAEVASKAAITLKGIIVTEDGSLPHGAVSFKTLLLDSGGCFPSVTLDPREDVALILFSSGTTGLPKGVMLTHYNIVAMLSIMRHENFRDNLHGPGDQVITLSYLPLFHGYGLLVSLTFPLAAGARVVTLPRFDVRNVLSCIEQHRVTVVRLVPAVLTLLINSPLVSQYDLSSIRLFSSSAAPLTSDTQLKFKRLLNIQNISQSFGMTETSGSVISNFASTGESKPGSIGRLLPNTEAKVIDVDSKQPVGANQHGELCLRGPQIMKGYLNNEAATRATIDDDGWLHSGDICYYDDQERFFVVDRIKELIKYKAFQVAPAELESLILTHPSVMDVSVIGIPDAEAGEIPRAYVVVKPGKTLTEAEVKQFVAGHVSHFKLLRGGVRFLSEIPKTETGKVLRQKLRSQLLLTSASNL